MFDIIWTTVPFITTQKWLNISHNIPSVYELEKSELSIFDHVELVLLAPSLLLLTYLLHVVHVCSLFHPNLLILFVYAFCWLFCGYLGRLYLLMIRLGVLGNYPFLLFLASFLRFQYYGNIITVQLTLVGERIFATYFVSDYEKNHRIWINFIVLPLTTLITQILSLPFLFLNVPLILPFGYFGSLTLFSFTMLNYLYSSNSRKLAHLKLNPIMYTLSKKFQLEENIRIMWYLRGFLFFFISVCIVMSTLVLSPSIFGFSGITVKSVVGYIDIAVALTCTVIPITMFSALYYVKNPAFMRRHKWLFGEEISTIGGPIGPPKMAPNEETNEYFSQLKKSWE